MAKQPSNERPYPRGERTAPETEGASADDLDAGLRDLEAGRIHENVEIKRWARARAADIERRRRQAAPMRVVQTEAAKRDLDDIFDLIARENPGAGGRIAAAMAPPAPPSNVLATALWRSHGWGQKLAAASDA